MKVKGSLPCVFAAALMPQIIRCLPPGAKVTLPWAGMSTPLMGCIDAPDHQMFAARSERDLALGRNVDALDGLHGHDAILVDAFMHLHAQNLRRDDGKQPDILFPAMNGEIARRRRSVIGR